MPLITEQEQGILLAVGLAWVGVVVLRWLYFHSKLHETRHLREEYSRLLNELEENPQYQYERIDKLAEINQGMHSLFKQANTIRPFISFSQEPEPFGTMGPSPSSVRGALHSFHDTVAYFRVRRNETLSVVYWFETIGNLPKKLLEYLGVDPHGRLAEFINVLARVVAIVVGVLAILERLQMP